VFEAECYAISEAVKMAAVRSDSEELKKVKVFSNTTTAIKRVQYTRLCPGQSIAIKTVEHNNKLYAKGIQVLYRWATAHQGVKGNEKPDEKAKVGALGKEEGVKAIEEKYKGMSLAAIQRRVLDAKWTETEQWLKAKLCKKAMFRMNVRKRKIMDIVSQA
jgi:hypothetical protein